MELGKVIGRLGKWTAPTAPSQPQDRASGAARRQDTRVPTPETIEQDPREATEIIEGLVGRLGEPDWRGPEAQKRQVADIWERLEKIENNPFKAREMEQGLHRLIEVTGELEIAPDLFGALARTSGRVRDTSTGLAPTGLLRGIESYFELWELGKDSALSGGTPRDEAHNALTVQQLLTKGEVNGETLLWFWEITRAPTLSFEQAKIYESLPPHQQEWTRQQIEHRRRFRADGTPRGYTSRLREELPVLLEAVALLATRDRPEEHREQIDAVAKLLRHQRSRVRNNNNNKLKSWRTKDLWRLLDHLKPRDPLASIHQILELEAFLNKEGFREAY